MARFRLSKSPGQSRTSAQQTRNAVSALGQKEAFATYVGTWFAGIGIGVVLFLGLVAFHGINSDARVNTARAASSDRNGTELVGLRSSAEREKIAQEGYASFKAAGCQGCHQQGGYGVGGQGPRLAYSGNAYDSTYLHSIVRWGYYPMPQYLAAPSDAQQAIGIQQLSDENLYKIVTYIQYAHDNRGQRPAWVDAQ